MKFIDYAMYVVNSAEQDIANDMSVVCSAVNPLCVPCLSYIVQ